MINERNRQMSKAPKGKCIPKTGQQLEGMSEWRLAEFFSLLDGMAHGPLRFQERRASRNYDILLPFNSGFALLLRAAWKTYTGMTFQGGPQQSLSALGMLASLLNVASGLMAAGLESCNDQRLSADQVEAVIRLTETLELGRYTDLMRPLIDTQTSTQRFLSRLRAGLNKAGIHLDQLRDDTVATD